MNSTDVAVAVTRDPFIVLTSNVFAILGLRALYFLLAGALRMFRYRSVGLAAILCFVGAKMLLSHHRQPKDDYQPDQRQHDEKDEQRK